MIIRPAIPEDHEALQTQLWALNQFEQEISGDRRIDRAGATDSLAEALDTVAQQDGAVLVAEQAGRIAGHLFMYFEMDDVYVREDLRSYALISNLFVDEALRGQGVGRALMAEAEKIAAARGVKQLRLNVLVGNERARRVYEEAGFSAYGIEMVKPLPPRA